MNHEPAASGGRCLQRHVYGIGFGDGEVELLETNHAASTRLSRPVMTGCFAVVINSQR